MPLQIPELDSVIEEMDRWLSISPTGETWRMVYAAHQHLLELQRTRRNSEEIMKTLLDDQLDGILEAAKNRQEDSEEQNV